MFVKLKEESVNIIPGFKTSIGITMWILATIILIPLASIFIYTSKITFSGFINIISSKEIQSAFFVSFTCALVAALINIFFGSILAWVLAKYEFPLKSVLDGLIEIPFALPTAVAGIALTYLYSDKGWIGSFFAKYGINISYTKTGIIIAMVFVGIPLVVRTLQPVIENLDKQYEEGAMVLGASKGRIFFKIILPEIFPTILTGFALALAKGIGEYGSVVFIAGNIPNETQTLPLIIMMKLEQFKYEEASVIALIMLIISLVILLTINLIHRYVRKRNN